MEISTRPQDTILPLWMCDAHMRWGNKDNILISFIVEFWLVTYKVWKHELIYWKYTGVAKRIEETAKNGVLALFLDYNSKISGAFFSTLRVGDLAPLTTRSICFSIEV